MCNKTAYEIEEFHEVFFVDLFSWIVYYKNTMR